MCRRSCYRQSTTCKFYFPLRQKTDELYTKRANKMRKKETTQAYFYTTVIITFTYCFFHLLKTILLIMNYHNNQIYSNACTQTTQHHRKISHILHGDKSITKMNSNVPRDSTGY